MSAPSFSPSTASEPAARIMVVMARLNEGFLLIARSGIMYSGIIDQQAGRRKAGDEGTSQFLQGLVGASSRLTSNKKSQISLQGKPVTRPVTPYIARTHLENMKTRKPAFTTAEGQTLHHQTTERGSTGALKDRPCAILSLPIAPDPFTPKREL